MKGACSKASHLDLLQFDLMIYECMLPWGSSDGKRVWDILLHISERAWCIYVSDFLYMDYLIGHEQAINVDNHLCIVMCDSI